VNGTTGRVKAALNERNLTTYLITSSDVYLVKKTARKATLRPARTSSMQLASKDVEIAWYKLNLGISFVIGVES
jgi:hypothetical protein